jgi:DNA-binding NtrC family response regulator
LNWNSPSRGGEDHSGGSGDGGASNPIRGDGAQGGARESLEKGLLAKALARNSGNLTKAATELGISRPTLYDLMEKFGIPKE